MMQIVKNFVFGSNVLRSDWNNTPLEDQINEYLENHPGFSVATMSMLNGTGYREVLVVFNVMEERSEKKPFVKDNGDKKVKRND